MPVPLRYYAAHTGRWGGDDKINLQNLPSRGANGNKLKQSIRAPAGHLLIDSDSSQIEARILAWLAGQDDLVTAFANGEDVYKIMAASIYAKPAEEITKEERFVGKTTILGCFSADTKVLTNFGWKSIVNVQATDMVWDGEEWVTHQGVVPKGVRETIHAWGINATPEHEILTEHGWREWSEVVTNPILSQSAFNKATLPSLTGSNITNQTGVPQDGIQSYDVLVDGKVSLTDTILKQSVLHSAIPALKLAHTKSGTGSTSLYSQMKRIVQDYLTAFQRVYLDVITPNQKFFPITVGGVFQFTNLGAKIVSPSYSIYLRSMGGVMRHENLTESTLIKGTNQTILGLLHAVKTWLIEGKSKICKKKLMTYDIAYAGPRNRFTVATNAGPIIVHNCGYGMGAAKFQAQLKTFGVDTDLEEAKRIITVYRETYPRIPELWKQAQKCLGCIVTKTVSNLGRAGVLEFDPSRSGFLLPNGLWQRYEGLTKQMDETGKEQYVYPTRRGTVKIYGGKIVENICQALARCVIAEQLVKINSKYKVVLTVHDAVACIAKKEIAHQARDYVEQCMRATPKWAVGLPLNCESGMGESYGDC